MKKSLRRQFSRAAKTYERWALPQKESAEILVKLVNPHGRVLDLGCGTGFVSEFLQDCEVVGLDLSEDMVREYKKRFGKGVVGNAEELPFKEESFDFVLSNFSLHWTDWKKSIKEALRVAKLGVGVSIPVEGSVSFSSFPFPKHEEILETFRPDVFKIKEINIPFEGFDLIRFFHYTGTANYRGKEGLLPPNKLSKLAKELKKEKFIVLFFYIKKDRPKGGI
ncbi:class I SAM-dependent methyltransferase [Aquifex sp.]